MIEDSDLRSAVALPALLIAMWLMPVVGLLPSPPNNVLGYVYGAVAVFSIVWWIQYPSPQRRRVGVAAAAMAATGLTFAIVYAFGRFAGDNEWAQQPMQYLILIGVPVLAFGVGAWALAKGLRLAAGRRLVAIAWLAAIGAAFAISPILFSLSDRAGNAGMDVIAMFVTPALAVVAWAVSEAMRVKSRRVVPEATSTQWTEGGE